MVKRDPYTLDCLVGHMRGKWPAILHAGRPRHLNGHSGDCAHDQERYDQMPQGYTCWCWLVAHSSVSSGLASTMAGAGMAPGISVSVNMCDLPSVSSDSVYR